MLIVIFIEAIIGMNFFGGKLGDTVGDLVDTHEVRWHFDYFSIAFASTWMCITTEAYTNVMYLAYDRVGVTSIIYFMQLISVGTWVMLNMFLAILCDEMARQHGHLVITPLAVPQLGSCASQSCAGRLWATRHSQGEGPATEGATTASDARASA